MVVKMRRQKERGMCVGTSVSSRRDCCRLRMCRLLDEFRMLSIGQEV